MIYHRFAFLLKYNYTNYYLYEINHLAKSFIYFSSFAIFVSCLGLFGLALFTAKLKTKEIGIRKTLGATAQDITIQLGSDYLKWILISSIIACPVSFILMSEWLSNNFEYRTDIGISVFIIAILLTVIISIFSIIFQTLKAALTNPVESLRDE